MKMTYLLGVMLVGLTIGLTLATSGAEGAKAPDARQRPLVLQPEDILPGWRSDLVAERYWGQAIRDLRPLRVFVDRSNVVVVTNEDKAQVSGFYIVTAVSSYRPKDDGRWTFVWDEQVNMLRFRLASEGSYFKILTTH